MRSAVLLGLLLIPATVAGQEAKPDYTKMKAEWTEKAKATHELDLKFLGERIKEQDAVVADLKQKVAKATKAATKKSLQVDLALAEKEQVLRVKQKESAEKAGYFSGSDPSEVKVGYFGPLYVNGTQRPFLTAVQVIDKGNALMKWGGKTFWVELDASKLADGDRVEVTQFVHCPGTKQYDSALGKRTVLLLRIIPD
jgi:hypothetical protein